MKNVSIAAAASGLRGLGFSSLWIFSALYFRQVLGLSVFEDGLIIMAATLAGAILQKFSGSYSDKIGHKRVVVASLSVLTALYLLLVLSSFIRHSPIFYTITFVTLTLSGSSLQPSIYSIVSSESEIKSRGFSILRVGNNIGWGFGPAIGGFAVYALGFYYIFVFGFLSVVAALMFALFLREGNPETSSIPVQRNENTLLMVLSFTALLIFIVQAQETVTLSNYANIIRGLNYFQLGLIYMVNGLAVVATQGIVYRLIRRIGNFGSFVIGSVVYSAGFLSFGLFSNLSGMLVATLILTIGEDFAFPSSAAMVSLISKPQNIGRNMGFYNMFISVGRAMGPLLGGVILSVTSVPLEIWGLATISGFLSGAIFAVTFRKQSSIQEGTDRKESA